MKTKMGYTIIEIMVTLAVAAILAMTALPSMKLMILNSKMTSKTNEFIRGFNYARSEAIKRSKNVGIRRGKITGISPTIEPVAWGEGWIIGKGWVIDDHDPANSSKTDKFDDVFLQTSFDEDQILIQSPPEQDAVWFNSRGWVPQAQSESLKFILCSKDYPQIEGRQVTVRATGNASVEVNKKYKCS